MTISSGKPEEIQGYRSFELDLPSALLEQVISIFDSMEQGNLTPAYTGDVPDAQGVYQLYHRDKLVYIGKTDGQAGLRQRLSRHAWTIQSRHNLDVAELGFKAVQVLVFSAMDIETALIGHYKSQSQHPAWNGSGFGSNDPGRRRDRTVLKDDGFDASYPINIDVAIEINFSGDPASVLDQLSLLMSNIPYTLRYEKTDQAISELKAAKAMLPRATTVRSFLHSIIGVLPPGWQATKLPGRVIMYREEADDYPGGEILARS